MRYQNCFLTPKRYVENTRLFYMGTPPVVDAPSQAKGGYHVMKPNGLFCFSQYRNGVCAHRGEIPEFRKRSLYLLERYFYLILFNTYLHMERRTKWQRSFSQWMTEVATAAGVYEILDNFGFHDFEKTEERLRALRWRWRESYKGKPSN